MRIDQLLSLAEKVLIVRGSAGSGNFGHDGRPGRLGGSQGGGGLRRIGAKKDSKPGDRKKAAKKFREKRAADKKKAKKKSAGEDVRDPKPKNIPDAKSAESSLRKFIKKEPGLSDKQFDDGIKDLANKLDVSKGDVNDLLDRIENNQTSEFKKLLTSAQAARDETRRFRQRDEFGIVPDVAK